MKTRLFDFGPVLLAALFVLLGTTQQGESARVEEAAVASVDQTEAVVIPGLQTVEKQVPEVGAKVQVAVEEEDLYWYLVVGGQTVGTYLFHGTKSAAIGVGGCMNQTTEICLYGSTQSNLNNHSVGSPSPEFVITKSAP